VHLLKYRKQSVEMICSKQAFSSTFQAGSTSSSVSASTAAGQTGNAIDVTLNQAMTESLSHGRTQQFVEHVVVATVPDFIEGEIIEQVVDELKSAMAMPGVLATHVGRCEPMLGAEHTFMMHIRAVDTASFDAAYRAARDIYGKHLTLHDINKAEDHFGDMIVVDFNSNVIGALDAKWPAIRIAIFKYKSGTCQEKKESLIQVLSLLPTLFPSVKQVSWGQNIAKERTCKERYGYADADLGVILGFGSAEDMHALGSNPKYWELLNFHGTSILEHYQVLTLCTSQ
jgi:hypothetical protein